LPYVPTPHEVVEKMGDVGEISGSVTMYDLGCGDGCIVEIVAKTYGAQRRHRHQFSSASKKPAATPRTLGSIIRSSSAPATG
jgi:hypothetical protein